jgi:uncharacterized short protein YbdD (DUF466 family)
MTAREAFTAGRAFVHDALNAVRRIVGVPDYDRYVRHMRARHPGAPLQSRAEFFNQCWEDKAKRPGNRCC